MTAIATVVTPSEVRAAKARLDPFARAFDRSVAECPNLHPFVRGSWAEFYRGWRQFVDAEPSWLHAANEFDLAAQYEGHLLGWQTQLAPICPLSAPPLERRASSLARPGPLEHTVRTVAIAGAVVAVALAVRGITR